MNVQAVPDWQVVELGPEHAPDPTALDLGEIDSAMPLIELALEASGDDAGPYEVRRRILAGEAQCWIGEAAVIVTEIAEAPSSLLTQHCWLAAGELEGVGGMIPPVEAYGRAQGCTFATINGRHGWARVVRRRGYAPIPNPVGAAPHQQLLRKAL